MSDTCGVSGCDEDPVKFSDIEVALCERHDPAEDPSVTVRVSIHDDKTDTYRTGGLRPTPEQTRRTISETADPIRLKTQLKRGSGTRDQDTIEVKVRGDDPEEAVATLNETIARLRSTVATVRSMQPGDGDE